MAIHECGQMYLETIYILSQDSAFVRAIDVGEHPGGGEYPHLLAARRCPEGQRGRMK